jgi:RES domain-containing protein
VLLEAYAQTPFDGEEAYLFGGRWSSPGIRLSYASEHQSLAMLEYFVHLDQGDPPDDLVLAVAEFPGDIKSETVEAAKLPANWRDSAAPPELARFGDEFAQRKEHCLLWVPSVLAPSENNCLINTAHPDFKRMIVREVAALRYDSRMFQKKPSRRRH